MRVGVPRETTAGERRVALVPDAIARLDGITVAVERGPGSRRDSPTLRTKRRARSSSTTRGRESTACSRWRSPRADEVGKLREGELLVSFLQPLTDRALIEQLTATGVLGFAMESIPRTTRAQPMDALSSQATVAGYKAVLLAAERLPRFFPMLTTAAGTIAPARVLVLGAGVAGLQALATARRLGAVVSGFDVRPAVREQVQSLGATFLDLGVVGEETEGGYARELTAEEQAQQQRGARGADPGLRRRDHHRRHPRPAGAEAHPGEAVEHMRPGSVIVDLAAETGGNCELTQPRRDDRRGTASRSSGRSISPSSMPTHASQLYARNVSALLAHLAPGGELTLDWDDEITAGTCVTRKPEPAPPTEVAQA